LANHIIVFCKNPKLGHVKTRVAATAGDVVAFEVYKQLLSITFGIVDSLDDSHIHIYYDAFIDNDDLWPNKSPYSKHIQSGSDLGQRMRNAFKDVFLQDAEAKVLIIGSDCPYLRTSDFSVAFDLLDDREVVLGPSDDGGYYLLGLSLMIDGLFDDIDWSTEHVLNQTVSKIMAPYNYHRLPVLEDIDTYDQWLRYKSIEG
jgi:uncharacterized protein